MRSARGFLVPALVLALAIVIAVLALDARSWDQGLRDGDALYSTSSSAASWHGSPRLPADPARRLLGIADDLKSRHALQRYVATAARRGRLDNATDVAADRAETETALAGVGRSSDPVAASQALTLLGILTFSDFARGGGKSAGQAEAALAYFDSAVRIDPTNDAAKYDLELALQALTARGVRVGPGSGTGTGSTGRQGAGSGTPGRGY